MHLPSEWQSCSSPSTGGQWNLPEAACANDMQEVAELAGQQLSVSPCVQRQSARLLAMVTAHVQQSVSHIVHRLIISSAGLQLVAETLNKHSMWTEHALRVLHQHEACNVSNEIGTSSIG